MTQFKVGDRVQTVKGKHPYMAIDGEKGVIVSAYVPGNRCNRGVVLVKFGDGATLGFHEHEIQIVDEPRKILITHKDGITTARLLGGKKTIKSAEAKCAAGDTFNFATGAALAFDRLMGRDKPQDKQEDKQESVKLYCVKDYMPGDQWTRGKIYELDSDFRVTYDRGGKSDGHHESAESFVSTVNKNTCATTIVPLVARPAKVGEWVYINAPYMANNVYAQGDIMQVTSLQWNNSVLINRKNAAGIDKLVVYREYLVLDGYNPELTCANCANWRAK